METATHARSISLGLYATLTPAADALIGAAATALSWREATEDFEDGYEAKAPRRSMTRSTFDSLSSILTDLALDVAESAEYRSALYRSEAAGRREMAAQTAKRRSYAAMVKQERETGKCSRCGGQGVLHGYRQDGGVCYRCNGSGRAR